ncbi:cytochrome P450 4V2 [Nephila pilipes]|uniref:Cytochrome P450 4V2 n=1 Tax=Nephila pilipes TaxID=299642 RepID=A0A8X6Q512_NEPPI|nr:cytochrome P450 4V2 [Nephila pilipes]
MIFVLFTFFLFGLIVVVFRYSLWRHKYSDILPGNKPKFFDVLGDVKEMLKYKGSISDNCAMHRYAIQVMREATKRFGKKNLFCLWVFYVPFVFLVKAEAVKELLKGNKMNDKSWIYKCLKPLLGSGLIISAGEKWKSRRKLLSPCFHIDILRGYMSIFNEQSQQLVKLFEEETKKDFTYISYPVTLATLEVISEAILGVKIGALDNEQAQYVNALHRITESFMTRMYKFWEWPDFIFRFTKTGRQLKRDVKMFHDYTRSVIQKKKTEYLSGNSENNKGKRKALLDILLEQYLETQELSEEDMMEEVNTFFMAGHDTVSITITWALYIIGLYPEVQAKIHEELDRIFAEDMERPVTYKDFNDLVYLNCVLKEANRLYPTVPMVARQVYEDTSICGHTIPKGATAVVFTYFLHRDEEIFPDPEKFDPNRFLPENYAKIPEYAYIPFSAGPRNCIGQKFAIMEIKVIIASILRKYAIESLDPRDKVLPLMHITLHSSIPIRVRIRARKLHKL